MKPKNISPPAFQSNQDEIKKFAQLAQEWWDEQGPFKPLHALNPTRIRFIVEHIKTQFHLDKHVSLTPLKGLNILDIGCGGGIVTESLCRLGATITGIDAAHESIQIAKAHAESTGLNINYQSGGLELVHDQQFDVITCLEVIEHVEDMPQFLTTLLQHVKPHGLLCLSTLNRTLKSYLLGIFVAERILKWVPKGTHEWQKFIKPAEIITILNQCNSRMIDIKGIEFLPLSQKWHLTNRVDVNYISAIECNIS